MTHPSTRSIGGAWLLEHFGLETVNDLAVRSCIGASRRTAVDPDGLRTETYQESMRPDATLRAHLTFHLKHEVPHLELMSRLFEKCGASPIEGWIKDERSGQYARRAGFFYEWLMGQMLDVAGMAGAYVDALDGELVLVAIRPKADRRWRVRDNLPGSPAFCPTVRINERSRPALDLDCQALLNRLSDEFGSDLLLKSAVWLTLRESRASFEIEGEADKADRVKRFADVLHRRTGEGDPPLTDEALAVLQAEILGKTSLAQFGLRRSPVFIGQSIRYQEHVFYIAPPADQLPAMLDGLQRFLRRTSGASPVARSAVAAFGFVYIHPLADGNGRVHRFLINDVLRRDRAVPDGVIVPVSGMIARDPAHRLEYDRVLDSFSRPFMDSMRDRWSFEEGTATDYPDGIRSNLRIDDVAHAGHAWRYIDLTRQVEYMGRVIEATITQDMRAESAYLRSHLAARDAVKNIIEMPDSQIDRVIRSIESNQGRLSGVLAKEIPALLDEPLWNSVKDAVQSAFASIAPAGSSSIDDRRS